MEMYMYKAKDVLNNKIVKGEMETENEEAVRKFLAEKYLYPIFIKKKTALNSDLGEAAIFNKPIKMKDITFFCKQFAAMIQAGISIAKALEICAEQTSHKSFKKHLQNIHSEVTRGRTLSEAVRDENIFPDILVSMIECGEVSGNLDAVLNQVVDHFDTQLGTARKIKKAMTYPAIVVGVIIVVVFILMIKVIPSYVEMFNNMEIKMPLPTVIVIAVSNFFVANWLVIVLAAILLVVAGFNINKIPSCKKAVDSLALKIPLFGSLNRKTLSASFSNTMAMLVSSGLPMLQAMEIVKKVLNNDVAMKEIDMAIESLKHGNSLYDSLRGSKIYPVLMFSMINIGEETGELDDMLLKVGKYFNEEVQASVDSLITMIEPMLTIIMAVVVGGIMLAVMMPTFSAAVQIS